MDSAERLNILVVDDRPEKGVALSSILDGLKENLIVVHSGNEALKQLLEKDFALVVLDVHMPVMDGLKRRA